jgi:DNA-binding SARP family transcriptional activator
MLRIRVLGELSVEADGVALEPPTGRPARALLGWLALHPGVHARSTVAGTLWPDVLEESSRRSLRNALSLARRALGSSGGALVATRETIALSAEPDVWVDVRAFDQLAAARQHEAALEVCRGELLAGLDDDWVLSARDRHRERQAELLAALAAAAEAAGDVSIAVGFARRRAALDPLDEPAHRDLMRTLAADGDRAGALVTYAALAERLRHELGIAASVQTRAFAQQLRREPPTPASASGGADVDGRACGDPRPQFPIRCVQARRRGDLLGRAAELAHLRERWKLSVGSGGMRLVVLTGEAGIGKTRLAAELGAVVHIVCASFM